MAQEPIANFSPLTIARQPPRFSLNGDTL